MKDHNPKLTGLSGEESTTPGLPLCRRERDPTPRKKGFQGAPRIHAREKKKILDKSDRPPTISETGEGRGRTTSDFALSDIAQGDALRPAWLREGRGENRHVYPR